MGISAEIVPPSASTPWCSTAVRYFSSIEDLESDAPKKTRQNFRLNKPSQDPLSTSYTPRLFRSFQITQKLISHTQYSRVLWVVSWMIMQLTQKRISELRRGTGRFSELCDPCSQVYNVAGSRGDSSFPSFPSKVRWTVLSLPRPFTYLRVALFRSNPFHIRKSSFVTDSAKHSLILSGVKKGSQARGAVVALVANSLREL